ncbi:hypothetical protein PUN28_010924 [Cardiocondyla obscurior]|uniref:Uncharacterized protein n=1 Tax=Cardiocondyla obscurior TaxID=286306 RepID=A0AAW2FM05_9HYME
MCTRVDASSNSKISLHLSSSLSLLFSRVRSSVNLPEHIGEFSVSCERNSAAAIRNPNLILHTFCRFAKILYVPTFRVNHIGDQFYSRVYVYAGACKMICCKSIVYLVAATSARRAPGSISQYLPVLCVKEKARDSERERENERERDRGREGGEKKGDEIMFSPLYLKGHSCEHRVPPRAACFPL